MAPELLLPTLPSLLVTRGTPFVHRDLSWVQFNERVLAEAKNPQNPPLERLKFLGITASNLDEFFMIRLASLGQQYSRIKKSGDPQERRRLMRVRSNLLESVGRFLGHQTEAFEILASELYRHGIQLALKCQPGDEAYAGGQQIFTDEILPRLPIPEPFLVSKVQSLEGGQLGVVFGQTLFFKIPKSLPWTYVLNDENQGRSMIYFLDDLLATHLGAAFRLQGLPGFVRVTRDGDLGVDLEEEDPESIPESVRSKLGSRERGRPVRLQWMGDLSDRLIQRLLHLLRLSPQEVFPVPVSMGLHSLPGTISQISGKPELRYRAIEPTILAALKEKSSVFSSLAKRDILLHHPYDSFDGFVNWIRAACADPDVIQIEQTVYRMDALSPIVEALKSAAKSKRVRIIIELRARFDELNNLKIADELRRAGVEVAFGFGRLKLHAKVALVTRKEPEGTRLYTHLSTGNYNATTARQYTDLAILTAHPDFGADARYFFDSVWDQRIPSSFKQLVSAPLRLHRRLLGLIEAETQAALEGRKARIVAKVNALVDETVTENLYKASRAGVQIDLLVRGACSLVPGVKGLSENIRVISVVDRFLEHSRIYYFADSKQMYLSSADWMPRNFFSRLELAFPVLDPRLYSYLEDVLIPVYLLDTVKACELTGQGIWKKRTRSSIRKSDTVPTFLKDSKEPVNAQAVFESLARRGYKETPLSGRS